MYQEVEVIGNSPDDHKVKWGKVIDQEKCIGCHACSTACKSENAVPLGMNRTFVKAVEVGTYPDVNRYFQVDRCNQCEDAPCVPVCPVTAMYQREDGIVDFDQDVCIGCKACMAACPYDAININPDNHSAEKCNFCAHRIDQGLEPACVVVCPEEAIIVGDLNDPESEVSQIIARQKVDVRKPEKATSPKVFYVGADESTLSPSAAEYQGAHMWSEQNEGYPVDDNRSTVKSLSSTRVAYEVPHKAPWDWRVSFYTWTKSISAGLFMMYAFLGMLGFSLGSVWATSIAIISGVFLGITGIVLIADLTHPMRFYRIFTRPQWKSWLVKGAFIIAGYAIVLLLLFIAGVASLPVLSKVLWWPGMILAVFTAIYTAFLFSKSKGRDLWQNPLLPLHFFIQAALCGAAGMIIMSLFLSIPEAALQTCRMTLIVSVALHIAIVISEAVIPHMTADQGKAAHNMIKGKYSMYYWVGLIVGGILPFLLGFGNVTVMGEIASVLVLGGLLAYEHAYVQAGQSVPLT
ncbi:4Fe-4S dicluster domain-containing protein [Scopulibacillus cellulosilyticus]|uniref:4Fe-4S dicluster domain-containing protein n=1 Tax=Scopulibacillus cellulosilyticus TaxID=2665665 RepID=A0ABW2Q2L8_9BACL